MATINRKSFSSTIEPAKQPSILKVIVSNMTMSGFYRIVAVKTTFDAQGVGKDSFMDIMVNPRDLGGEELDVQKFDAISISGIQGRNVPNGGEPQANTTYVWARNVKAIGKHLVEKVTTEQGQQVLQYAGVGVYATASPEDVPNSTEPTGF
jgi:hypothetical protein